MSWDGLYDFRSRSIRIALGKREALFSTQEQELRHSGSARKDYDLVRVWKSPQTLPR